MKHNKMVFYLVLISLLGVCCVGAWAIDYLSIDNITAHKVALASFIAQHYLLSVLLFFAACIVFVNSPIPLAALLKVISGFFFGVQLGLIYNIVSTLSACVVGFVLSRYLFRNWFEKIYYARLKKVEDDIEENGFYYILSLRLMMIMPYFLTNSVAGISRISFKQYFWASALGVIPSSLIYANAGNRLEQINSMSELLSRNTVLAIVFIAFMVLLPVLNKKFHFVRLH